MEKNYRVGMDINCGVDEETSASKWLSDMQKICDDHNVRIVGMVPVGSGGGFPDIMFEGNAEAIKALCIWYHDGNEEFGMEYFEEFVSEA